MKTKIEFNSNINTKHDICNIENQNINQSFEVIIFLLILNNYLLLKIILENIFYSYYYNIH
jgi:hypothetical protein